MVHPKFSDDTRNKLLLNIAESNGFALFKKYSEASAAEILEIHPQTLKQMRLQGRISCIRLSPRKISYLGLQIADFIFEAIEWHDPKTPYTDSAKSGLRADTGQTRSTATGGTQSVDAQDALRLARQSLKKPKGD